MTGDPVSPDRLLQLGYAYREVKALLSAVELGVFTALSHGPLPLDALRETTEVHPRGARDFFDALVALGLLQRDANDLYSNTPATARYLDRSQPTYLGGELEFINAQLYARWNDLSKALRSGKPQTGAGAENYAVRYADPDALKKFTRAMTAATMPVAQALADAFAWHDYTSVIDIGTAEGCLPVHLAQSHAHLSGGGFDLPPIAAAFDTYVQSHDLSSRLRFWPGDFLKDALPSADVLIMGRVLHNWDAQTKTMLLRKAHDALPTGGARLSTSG